MNLIEAEKRIDKRNNLMKVKEGYEKEIKRWVGEKTYLSEPETKITLRHPNHSLNSMIPEIPKEILIGYYDYKIKELKELISYQESAIKNFELQNF